MFQPGVDPALPQALPEAPFAAGGGGARRRVSALQGGAGGAGVWQVVLNPKVTVVPHEGCSQWPVPNLPEVSAGFQEPSHPDEAHVELALNPVPQL